MLPPIWTNSLALEKLRHRRDQNETLRIAFLDVDYTLTGEPAQQLLLRHQLEKHGYVIAFMTARTSELCLSWAARATSSAPIQRRLKAKPALDPASFPSMQGLLDPDVLAPVLGGELLIKQINGGFAVDEKYAKSIPYSSTIWGDYGARLADQLTISLGTIAPQVLLAKYWVQVSFQTAREKNAFVTTVRELQQRAEPPVGYDQDFFAMVKETMLTDESHPHANPPSFAVFITHKNVHKMAAVDYVMQVLTDALALPARQIEVLLAGDGPSDLRMGFYGAAASKATFLIPGGARLARYLIRRDMSFIDPEFSAVPNQLVPRTNQRGYYHFAPTDRTVILGDEAFPGTNGPETLLAWLDAAPHQTAVDY